MIIGVPKEIKNNEFRVGIVPSGARILNNAGHQVFIQKGAGEGSGIVDEEYYKAGSTLLDTAEEVFDQAEMIIKVKEPLPQEYGLIKEDQIIFTFLHLAPLPDLIECLTQTKCIGVAYETIQLGDGSLPLLTPMSEVAGRLAPQMGAYHLGKANGGRGVLLGGVPGVERARVTIIGGGVVGTNAAKIAIGLGAEVYLLDVNQRRMAYLDDIFGNAVTTIMSDPENIDRFVAMSDLVIGAVLVPGARAPALVTKKMISKMAPGSVVVDVAIDQGGCFETSRPTTHEDPTFLVDEVVHYCVANIPGAVPRTSTFALANVTLPYVLDIANKGIKRAAEEAPALAMGVNVCGGNITHPGLAGSVGCDWVDVADALGE